MPSLLLSALLSLGAAQSPAEVETSYWVYVASESEDLVSLVRFDAASGELTVEQEITVGYMPPEIEGPHGLTVDPTGDYWYLSLAHGTPNGWLYKYSTDTNEPVARCELGLFPATMQISEATGLLYCVNFDLHGDMSPSSVSVVDPEEMVEVDRITTGPMPHGSRITSDGLKHYSCSMMSDTLYEIDAARLEVSRRLFLTTEDGQEVPKDAGMPMAGMSGGSGEMKMRKAVAKPTWAHPHPTRDLVYVALNGAAQVVEVDTAAWRISRRFPTDKGPYNVEVTPDGSRLVVTYKSAQGIGVFDVAAGREVARLRASKRVTHGVATSPDSRYAFVSNESIGGDPGTLDVVDLERAEVVASTPIGLQAGGITFWKMEASQTATR